MSSVARSLIGFSESPRRLAGQLRNPIDLLRVLGLDATCALGLGQKAEAWSSWSKCVASSGRTNSGERSHLIDAQREQGSHFAVLFPGTLKVSSPPGTSVPATQSPTGSP